MRRQLLSLIARALSVLVPDSVLTVLRSSRVVTRALDYPHHRVFIAVESDLEFNLRARSCEREPETVEWIEHDLRPGDVLFDIGANVGTYSLIAAARHGDSVCIYAVEPGGANYAQLCRNIVLNGFQRVITPLPIALSDRTGLDTFNYSTLLPGGALHTLGADPRASAEGPFKSAFSHAIVALTLDTAIQLLGLPSPTHIKIDVDGSELRVLHGAAQALKSCRSILIEIDPADGDANLIALFLGGEGFVVSARHSRHNPSKAFASLQYWVFTRPA
jgi:FkbM family methyltransferase